MSIFYNNSCQYVSERVGIEIVKRKIDLQKELFRKSIHLCTVFIPFLLSISKNFVLIALSSAVVIYTIAECLRRKGYDIIPLLSKITETAARKRDQNRFVLGPVTLSLGILITILLFNTESASIGILALGIGDGLASLSGKLFGKLKIPYTSGKTVAGSLTCFFAIYCSSTVVCGNPGVALKLAVVGMFIELLPLKDFDNLVIPLILAFLAQYVFI